MKTFWVYILKMQNGNLYTGMTTDIERRFQEHSSGKKGAKFTRAFKPKELAASWQIEGRSEALKLEAFIKKKTRQIKLSYIENPELLMTDYKISTSGKETRRSR